MKKSIGLFFLFFGLFAKAQSLFEVNGTVFSEGQPNQGIRLFFGIRYALNNSN